MPRTLLWILATSPRHLSTPSLENTTAHAPVDASLPPLGPSRAQHKLQNVSGAGAKEQARRREESVRRMMSDEGRRSAKNAAVDFGDITATSFNAWPGKYDVAAPPLMLRSHPLDPP